MGTITADDYDRAHARHASWALVEDARHLCVAVVVHNEAQSGHEAAQVADQIEQLRTSVQLLANRCHPRTV